jgi:hypothetical protein
LTSVVGSNVAMVVGGWPVPVPSTTGVPLSRLRAVTVQRAIASPAGGVTSALTGTGAVTHVPSAGVAPVTVGTAPLNAVTLIVTKAGADVTPGTSVTT